MTMLTMQVVSYIIIGCLCSLEFSKSVFSDFLLIIYLFFQTSMTTTLSKLIIKACQIKPKHCHRKRQNVAEKESNCRTINTKL